MSAASSRPVAVVTGASAGVGRATAVAFSEAGFDVALLARGKAGLRAAAKDVERAGGRALTVPTDVAEWDQVDSAASRVEAELGPIEVWVNNAMTTVFAWTWDVAPAEFKRATEVTYFGQVHGTLAALARMRPRDHGRIVNVGSALSYVAIPLQAAYCGAKFACRGFSESVRAELLAEGSNVTISMAHLPAVNTPQFDWCLSRLPNQPQPVPPMYQPEVAAQAILDTAMSGRAETVLGSWNRVIVAGAQLFPEVLAHYAARTGVDSQQTDDPAPPGRPANLTEPVDEGRDAGSHGRFDEQAIGVLGPEFLRSVPKMLKEAAGSVWDAVQERLEAGARRAELASRLRQGHDRGEAAEDDSRPARASA